MKKLKTLFSPRKIIIWIFLIVLIITVPEITKPAMSETEAIITMMSIDKVDDNIKVATAVLTPADEKKANYEVFSGVGKTVGEAVENVSLSLGKSMGFAQCEIMAFGENLSNEGIMSSLDFMTRTRKVGRNALLINFSGDVEEFQQAIVNLNIEKSLPIEDIMDFDKRYIPTEDSNIHSFYKGYFSEISIGIMPKIQLLKEETTNAIEIASGATGGGSSTVPGSGTGGSNAKEYILNDGTVCVFKKGKKFIELDPEQMKKLNLITNVEQEGTLKVENVNDDLYNNSNVVLNIHDKKLKFEPKFDGSKPVFNIEISLSVLVEEVDEENPNKDYLKRNKLFITDALVAKTKETVKTETMDIIAYCKENQIDIIGVYENFYRKQYKKFKSYYDEMQEKYLEGIEYNVTVKVSSTY
ncbi:MAG: hypothetical protein IJW36_01865 [Clostridia bacterium]|nr:hypothetical protein [Clostridia bacterium]